MLLLGRLVLALYLLSSALAAFDRHVLAAWEIAVRLALAGLIMAKSDPIWIGAIVATAVVLFLHGRLRLQAHAS